MFYCFKAVSQKEKPAANSAFQESL